MKTRMVIKDRRTDGAVPVNVYVTADDMNVVVAWNECDLELPISDIKAALAGKETEA